jgi:hypothetical protein
MLLSFAISSQLLSSNSHMTFEQERTVIVLAVHLSLIQCQPLQVVQKAAFLDGQM